MSGQLRWAIFVVGIASVVGTALVPLLSPFDPPLGIWSLNLVAGLSLVVVGFLLFSRRPGDLTGPLLGIAGIFFFAFALSWFRSPYLWTVSALGLGLYRTFAGHMVVAFPDGRVRSTVDRVVVIAVYAWPLTANIVLLTLFDPRDYGWTEWARLQQWAAAGDVVMSANTFDAAGRPVEAEALEPAAVKGREALVSAYRLRPQATLASGP